MRFERQKRNGYWQRSPKDNHRQSPTRSTIFDWVLAGPMGPVGNPCQQVPMLHYLTNERLLDQLQKFQEMEEVSYRSPASDEGKFCESHFQESELIYSSSNQNQLCPFNPTMLDLTRKWSQLGSEDILLGDRLSLCIEYRKFRRADIEVTSKFPKILLVMLREK